MIVTPFPCPEFASKLVPESETAFESEPSTSKANVMSRAVKGTLPSVLTAMEKSFDSEPVATLEPSFQLISMDTSCQSTT